MAGWKSARAPPSRHGHFTSPCLLCLCPSIRRRLVPWHRTRRICRPLLDSGDKANNRSLDTKAALGMMTGATNPARLKDSRLPDT